MDRNIDYYMRLPYPVEVVPSEDGYFASVEDLPGCTAWVDNFEHVWSAVEQAKREWFEEALKREKRIPKPRQTEESLRYSGRVLVRMSKSLHRDLAKRARLEGVSVNQFIITALARAVGLSDTG